MRTDVESLTRQFSGLADEELLRVVTVERADYRPDARVAAAKELMQRGVPLPRTALEDAPPPAGKQSDARMGRVRDDGTASPYQLVDLFFDVAVFGPVWWATAMLEMGDPLLEVWLLGSIVNYLLIAAIWAAAVYLRDKWRKIEW